MPSRSPRERTLCPTEATGRAAAVLRILLGAIFSWSFLDKLFGLGFDTQPCESLLAGVSPTREYLEQLDGWFAGPLESLAGLRWVDFGFMGGLGLLGLMLLAGIGLRAAAWCGTPLLVLMWLSALPLQQNPALDEHVIYAAALFALAASDAGRTWGFACRWRAFLAARAPRLLPILG
ncbi:hypothetical protein [Arthrobacter woluwensis]|uniref:Thiosulfate dehydrogenase [quinone] large subunit n=1 Tax=Arthrobacter woluwensis TaxID=156980 RepID=A0A1H4JUA7_9MICC|nr:hypothetical protein [Arthrobacter woluwensis]SEB49455.1 thiosulfate dehydrogenase [quinone] large subunit [Arthrobacter woluwensis]